MPWPRRRAIALELSGGALVAAVVGGLVLWQSDPAWLVIGGMFLVPAALVAGITAINLIVLKTGGVRLIPNVLLSLFFGTACNLGATYLVQAFCGSGLTPFLVGWASTLPVACMVWHAADH
jgi:hypothetical protein